MSLLHSETDAALIQAELASRQLAERYELAVALLLELGEQAALFENRARALSEQADALRDLIEARGLLPKDPATELQDLRSLADQISGRLDHDQGEALRRRFQDQEQALLEQLELAEAQEQIDGIERWIEAGRARIGEHS